jgi:membrane protease YdiL (CAAX protease family)
MPKTVERVPPSESRVLVLSGLALAGYGGYRLFIAKLLPDTAASNLLPQDLAVAGGALVCALFLYWLGRLRYGGPLLRNLPGSRAAAALAVLGLVLAAACLQWRRPASEWTAANAALRAAAFGVALLTAACEEIGFRGALYLALREGARRVGPWPALAAGCLGFALVHAAYQSVWDLPFAAAAGLALGMARLRGASLLSLVAAHALLDGVGALWQGSSLSMGYGTALASASFALATALLLWFLPTLPPPLPAPAKP